MNFFAINIFSFIKIYIIFTIFYITFRLKSKQNTFMKLYTKQFSLGDPVIEVYTTIHISQAISLVLVCALFSN